MRFGGRDRQNGTLLVWSRVRRELLLARLRRQARLVGSDVRLDVAKDLVVEAGARVEVHPGTDSQMVVGPGCRLGRDVVIQLKGGSVRLGPRVEVRRGVRFSVAGEFIARGRNLFCDYTTIHCADRVEFERLAFVSEYVVVADSAHTHDDPDRWAYHQASTSPVHVGRHVWIAAKATVTRGVRLGDGSIVAANSVVIDDVPAGYLASGVPATSRPVPVRRGARE